MSKKQIKNKLYKHLIDGDDQFIGSTKKANIPKVAKESDKSLIQKFKKAFKINK